MPQRPKGTLLILHGLGEYGKRYKQLVHYFFQRDYAVGLFDQVGHGRSDGKRAHAKNLDIFIDDLGFFVGQMKEKLDSFKIPTFLLAHSFGGQIAINWLAQHQNLLDGFIGSSPNLRVVFKLPEWKEKISHLLMFLWPSFPFPSIIPPKYLSHDPTIVSSYKKDRLIEKKVTVGLGNLILENTKEALALAPMIHLPTLLLHGSDDLISDPEATKIFYKELASQDKEFKLYKGLYHEILNELEKEKIYKDIEVWLEKHL